MKLRAYSLGPVGPASGPLRRIVLNEEIPSGQFAAGPVFSTDIAAEIYIALAEIANFALPGQCASIDAFASAHEERLLALTPAEAANEFLRRAQ